MLVHEIKNFKYGLIDDIEAQSIPEGAASSVMNWLTKGDKVEVRRGMRLLGTEVTGTGKVTGLHVAKKADGTEILYRTYARKILYYDTVTEDWIEIGTNQLAAAASGEDVSFADYNSLAGAQLWLNSPNSSIYKIMTANPGSIVDQYNSAKNYKGLIKIKQNRMFLWRRNEDKTGVYGSYIDTQTYTTVTAEVLGTGNGSNKTFAGTLAFKSGGARRTCFGISVTDGVETFSDNYNGVLTGSAGGTGTINYASGAISVTFNTAPAGAVNITVTYQWEDSTNNGIADFSKSSPRTAGQGFVFRQDDGGGDVQNIASYGDVEYCLHEFKTWALTLSSTDTQATNLIYREKVGIPNWRAAIATGNGIYYIDDTDQNEPRVRILTLDTNLSQVIPVPLSLNLDLSDYRFDKAWGIEWGDYVAWGFRHKDSTDNNIMLFYHKIWKAFDKADIYASYGVVYNGTLCVGDSVSNNVYEIMSGFDDDDSLITNEWHSGISNVRVAELKKVKSIIIQGEIAPDQDLEVYISIDNGAYSLAGTIDGAGAYVDRGQSVNVGAVTIGRSEVGGGGGGAVAYNYEQEIKLRLDKFEFCKIKFVAIGIGYCSVSKIRFYDVRRYGQKLPRKYRA